MWIGVVDCVNIGHVEEEKRANHCPLGEKKKFIVENKTTKYKKYLIFFPLFHAMFMW